jgi:hypothetical protein
MRGTDGPLLMSCRPAVAVAAADRIDAAVDADTSGYIDVAVAAVQYVVVAVAAAEVGVAKGESGTGPAGAARCFPSIAHCCS